MTKRLELSWQYFRSIESLSSVYLQWRCSVCDLSVGGYAVSFRRSSQKIAYDIRLLLT